MTLHFRRTVVRVATSAVMIMVVSGCAGAPSMPGDETQPVVDERSAPLVGPESLGGLAVAELVVGVPDTGQSDTYDDKALISAPEVGSPFYGQDGSYTINEPSYVDNGDGTVSDQVTGLTWQAEHSEPSSWDDAVAGAESLQLGGYDDWRLPTIAELYSLVDYSGVVGRTPDEYVPFLDTDVFAFTYGSGVGDERIIDCQYWSSTRYAGTTMDDASTIFGVNFADGRIKGYPLDEPSGDGPHLMYSRYVRGDSGYGETSLVDNGDRTVTDTTSGLMWSQDDSGTGMDWEDALAFAEGASTGGYSDWRLPTARELQGIVDYARAPQTTGEAALDPLFTISTTTDAEGREAYPYFWTSTTLLERKGRGGGDSSIGTEAVYVAFGEAQGYMAVRPQGGESLIDVHGAGAVRSDPKSGSPEAYAGGRGPQGDEVRIFNAVRLVRDVA